MKQKKQRGQKMNAPLQKICEQFIENRETIKKTLKMGSAYVYPVCANLFCGKGETVEAEKLAECREILKQKAGIFSNFRGTIEYAVICMLALEEKPEEKLDRALAAYALMKKEFMASDYLALAAFMLADEEGMEEKVARGKRIYKRMQKEHPFLTSTEDSVYALMLAFAQRDDDALIGDMEECYDLLKKQLPSSGNYLQTVSHILALAEGDAPEKAERFLGLYEAVGQFGGKYGRYYELTVLAALSVLRGDVRQMAADMMDADAFLAAQKGYGFWGVGKKIRLMHAAMLISNLYSQKEEMKTASMSAAISMVIAQNMASLAAVSAATSAAAAASSGH